MPRPVRIRPSSADQPTGSESPRRPWIHRWKQWAIQQLPPTAPRAVRVQLRAEVERALGRLNPETDEEEVRDVVLGVVETTTHQLEAEARQQAREGWKRQMVALAPGFLTLALRKFPSRGTIEMLKRPGYSLEALTLRLTRRLERDLTGDESLDEVQVRVGTWVEARLAEQPPPPPQWPRHLLAGGAAAATVAGMALQNPKVKDAAARGLAKARDVLKRWAPTPPKDRQ